MFPSKLSPYQIIIIGFISISLIGSFLLTLPFSSANGTTQPYIDALFVAVSAISTTGLSVVDIGSFYSLFGQVVILVLFQIGGLGYMIFVVLVMYGLGIRLSLSGKIVLEESFSSHPYEEVFRFSKIVCIIAFFFELFGAAILSIYWMMEYPAKHAIYLGIFHSVSAFCTAGFSLFPGNFCEYRNSIFFNSIISTLCIGGSIGFPVVYDLYFKLFGNVREGEIQKKLSAHTRLVLVMIPVLLIFGWLLFFVSEWNSPYPSFQERFLASFFQTISATTTTGFNTVNIGILKTTALTSMLVLMYIGAPSGGTGGGVKSTTFGVLISSIVSVISMKDELVLFNRLIPTKIRDKALAICALALLLIITDIILLSITEKASYIEIVYETVSAFGTVGLSTGITPFLSVAGKLTICTTMLVGRIGPLAIGYSIRGKIKTVPVKYPEGVLLVG